MAYVYVKKPNADIDMHMGVVINRPKDINMQMMYSSTACIYTILHTPMHARTYINIIIHTNHTHVHMHRKYMYIHVRA